MRRTIDKAERRIAWNMIKGMARKVTGYWLVERKMASGGSRVTFTNYVDAGLLIPDILVRKKMTDDIRNMVKQLLRRIESGGTWQSPEYLERLNGEYKVPAEELPY